MNVEEQVTQVLNAYESAVNRSDLDAVMALFAKDGAVLAPGNPSAVGKDAVQGAYRGIFQAIQLSIKFQVAEIVEMSSDWAFARTHSNGTMTVHATSETLPEHNHELFLFQRDTDRQFKIARYSFSETAAS